LKRYEKESLLKNFFVFFILLELLLLLLFTELYRTQKREYKQNIFKTMHVCNYTMECKQFSYDFIEQDSITEAYTNFISKDFEVEKVKLLSTGELLKENSEFFFEAVKKRDLRLGPYYYRSESKEFMEKKVRDGEFDRVKYRWACEKFFGTLTN